MKLKTVTLKNYRCYQNNDFVFGSDTTIIIGKNGTGKSSLLSALRKGMTFIFSNTGNNKLIINNTNKVEGLNDWDTTYDENGLGFLWPTNIKYEIEFDNKALVWNFFKDKYKGKLHSKYYKEAQKKFEQYHLESSSILPLLGFYGDCYPHKRKDNNSVVNSFNKILTKSIILPRDAGYFLWNSDGSITSSWFLRTKFILNEIQHNKEVLNELGNDITLIKLKISDKGDKDLTSLKNQLSNIEDRLSLFKENYNSQTKKLESEFLFVKERVMKFFSKVNEFDTNELVLYDIKKRKTDRTENLFFSFGSDEFINEGIYNEESLPMGYQRLIHIVYDIAYRWYLLNGENEKFDGVVLIDELELHLHPSLQQTVLKRFRDTFPGIQFVITTHSPIILSNFFVDKENTRVIQLERVKGQYSDEELDNHYSMDYNSNLVDVMGVNISDKKLNTMISAYNFLISENKIEIAKKYHDKIKDFFGGNIPDFVIEKMKI